MSWLARAIGRSDPMFSFMWDISINSPAGPLGAEYVETANVPIPVIESDSIVFQGKRYFFAKFKTFGVISLHLYEDGEGTTMGWLDAWQQIIKTPEGDYATPSEYKGSITLRAQNTTGATTKTLTAEGVFPTTVSPAAFNSESGKIGYDVEFSLDNLTIG